MTMILRRRFGILAGAAVGLLIASAPQGRGAGPDFAKAKHEVVRMLQELIRIDTSNPPGNETRAAEYLKAIFAREGVPAEIFALEPDRGNIVARIRGTGRKKPLLLMGHTDVVPVEREKWTVDPFAAEIKGGYVYGRGATDNKGMVSAAVQVMLMLYRQKIALDRDVIFLGESAEEAGGRVGIGFMIERHWDKIEAEFALNEGGRILEVDGKVQYVGVETAQKLGRGIRLVARGPSGHSARPRLDNAIVRLAAAVAKIGEHQPPMRLNETTRTFFQGLAKISPPDEAFLYTHLEDPIVGAMVQEKIRHTSTTYNSMLRTTIAPTIIKGGFRGNVIPGEAEATIDIRALPDEDMDAFLTELGRIIDDPEVEIVPSSSRAASPPSRLDTDMYRALQKAQETVFPGAITLPIINTGGTNSAPLRGKGVQAYGLNSVQSFDDRDRVHGNDERMSVEGLGRFVEYLYHVVINIAVAR